MLYITSLVLFVFYPEICTFGLPSSKADIPDLASGNHKSYLFFCELVFEI